MSALDSAKTALEELRLATAGYSAAKKANPGAFSKTHNGKCEAALLDAIAVLSPVVDPPPPPPPPPPGTAWKWDATKQPVDPNSASLISAFLASQLNQPNIAVDSWAVATAEANPGDPQYAVKLTSGGNLDGVVRIPLGTQPDPSGDGHLTVRDVQMGREHDFWQATFDPTSRRIAAASAGVSFPLGADTEVYAGWGGNAANMPLRRGLITPEDLTAGVIDHPLVFSCRYVGGTSSTIRYPAIHNAPTAPAADRAKNIVEGTWLAFAEGEDLSMLTGTWALIGDALKRYGMFLRDNGGTTAFYAENTINRGGASAWKTPISPRSCPANFPWARLRVLVPPVPA